MPPDAGLLSLLAQERRALLAADWPALAALAPQKARAVEGLGRAGLPDAALLAGLARNQALLRAALEGVGEAARRRVATREARRCPTYDAGGGRASLPAPPRIERRA